MYCNKLLHGHTSTQTPMNAGTHLLFTKRFTIVNFQQFVCAHLRHKIGSIILSCHILRHPAQNPTAIFLCHFCCVTDMTAAFTLSRSVKDGTQTQEINLQWQSAIHHFHHFSCEKKNRKGIVFSPLRFTSSLSPLMSSLLVAGWLFCGGYRVFLLVQLCKTYTLEQ